MIKRNLLDINNNNQTTTQVGHCFQKAGALAGWAMCLLQDGQPTEMICWIDKEYQQEQDVQTLVESFFYLNLEFNQATSVKVTFVAKSRDEINFYNEVMKKYTS